MSKLAEPTFQFSPNVKIRTSMMEFGNPAPGGWGRAGDLHVVARDETQVPAPVQEHFPFHVTPADTIEQFYIVGKTKKE